MRKENLRNFKNLKLGIGSEKGDFRLNLGL